MTAPRGWLPWIVLGVVVVVVLVVGRVAVGRRAVDARAGPRRSPPSCAAPTARASRPPTRRRQSARAIRRDLARPDRRGPDRRRDPPGLRRPLRRVDPPQARAERARPPRLGPAGARARRSAPAGSSLALRGAGARAARMHATEADEELVRERAQPAERPSREPISDADGRARAADERDRSSASATSCCGRSTISKHERAAGHDRRRVVRALHDDYTARAAAVIRALRDGVDARPVAAPAVSQRRRVARRSCGHRRVRGDRRGGARRRARRTRCPGRRRRATPVDATPASTLARRAADRRRPARSGRSTANPDDVASRLLLARFLEADGDLPGRARAVRRGRCASTRRTPRPRRQSGRILYLTAGRGEPSSTRPVDGSSQQSRARLDHAIELDPSYADARFFRAIVLANEFGDFAAAQNDLQRYLIRAPDGSVRRPGTRSCSPRSPNALDGTPTRPPRRH